MPQLPLHIALISSATASGRKDFLQHLTQSHISFSVDCYNVKVQGPQVETEVCAALKNIATQNYDIVVITRGGGSQADLAWFDNLKIARLVATIPIKVIVGIGHETDHSVLDDIAHSVKTPTAAADTLIDIISEQYNQLVESSQKLQNITQTLLRHQNTRLNHTAYRFATQSRQLLQKQRQQWQTQAQLMLNQVQERLKQRQHHLQNDEQRLSLLSKHHIEKQRQHILNETATLKRRSQHQIHILTTIHEKMHWQIAAHDPQKIFAKGFVQLKNQKGHIIRSTHEVQPDETLTARLNDGTLTLNVTQCKTDNHT